MILDKLRAGTTAAAAASLLAACGSSTPSTNSTPSNSQTLSVGCTISTLCSLVTVVGGDKVTIHDIVPVGVSPETYEPTPQDLVTIGHVRVMIENGAGLESWMQKLIDDADARDVIRVVLSDRIPAADRRSGNPHLWLDTSYAAVYVDEIRAALSSADPAHAALYARNAAAETKRLASLDRWIRGQIATVPPSHRAMICYHDAWFYFDRRYGIDDIGAIERSPGQEPTAADFAALVAQARAHDVRAIFAEPQFSPKLADALASDAGIEVVRDLYDDTLGTTPALSSYEGMLRYDVTTIVEALRR